MLACPVTSQVKGYPLEVSVASKRIKGAILADQVRSLDWRARHFTLADHAGEATMNAVRELLLTLLGTRRST